MDLYCEPIQSRKRTPAAWENILGDAIEAAFARGVVEPEPLVEAINEYGSRQEDGQMWTVENFTATIKRLGADE